mgnify:CR=1 FL=1
MSFENPRYVSLKTYRKNGRTVATPLWVVPHLKEQDSRTLFAFTNVTSGKVKRIKNKPTSEIALCSLKGEILSSWSQATVTLSPEEKDVKNVIELMYKKYSWQMFLVDIFARIGRRRSSWIVLKIVY